MCFISSNCIPNPITAKYALLYHLHSVTNYLLLDYCKVTHLGSSLNTEILLAIEGKGRS